MQFENEKPESIKSYQNVNMISLSEKSESESINLMHYLDLHQ